MLSGKITCTAKSIVTRADESRQDTAKQRTRRAAPKEESLWVSKYSSRLDPSDYMRSN